MLRQPSQPTSISSPTGTISGLISAMNGMSTSSVIGVDDVGAADAGDEQPEALVHLRRGQADSGILVHGLEHVIDQLLNAG